MGGSWQPDTPRSSHLEWPSLERPKQGPGIEPSHVDALWSHLRVGRRGVRIAQTRDDFTRLTYTSSLEVTRRAEYAEFGGGVYRAVHVVESDDPRTLIDLKDFPAPPNVVTIRTTAYERGRWHALWVLEQPVQAVKPRSWAYLQRIDRELTRALGADPSFSHGLGRNFLLPQSSEYRTHWLHSHAWTLNELAEACGEAGFPVPRPGIRPRRPHPSAGTSTSFQRAAIWIPRQGGGVARNESLFRAMDIAFRRRAAQEGMTVQPTTVLAELHLLNAQISHDIDPRGPLPEEELSTIARSVARRCQKPHLLTSLVGDGSGGQWTPEQRRRGGQNRQRLPGAEEHRAEVRRLGRATRSATAQLLAAEAADLAIHDVPVEQIAQRLGRTTETVRRWLDAAGVPYLSTADLKAVRAHELRAQGFTRGQISEDAGVSGRTIQRWLQAPPPALPSERAESHPPGDTSRNRPDDSPLAPAPVTGTPGGSAGENPRLDDLLQREMLPSLTTSARSTTTERRRHDHPY